MWDWFWRSDEKTKAGEKTRNERRCEKKRCEGKSVKEGEKENRYCVCAWKMTHSYQLCVCVCVPAGRCPFNRLLWEVEALIKQDYVFPSVHQFPAAQSLPHTHTLPLLFCTYKHRMPSNYPQTEASTSYCHVIIHTLFHCLLSSHRHTCDPMSWGLLK